ncbi:hypothetical protein XH81_04230 [Bradyrhizobium sp. CCBAU 25360]|uniref:ATP-binding protein n=1 Tax=Bradyrhizobium sp. CCBAU 25360 TaxID=858425 RepID=UPI0023059231|nr:ATP-binding protein [Bradyrhizobium sp. CCBAU 25360]MDA9414073.1 hypothetical protein [Bradyrhizobium sp. CCBAU 25360]
MPIFFCGDITIDNYEFYGEFEPKYRAALEASATSQKGGSHGPDKVIVRQFGGTYLLARFTGVAWSVWYGTNNQKKPQMVRLQPWTKFHDRHLKRRQLSLFKQPREFDCNWQLSYRLQKFKDDRFRVAPSAYEGFTLPLADGAPEFVDSKDLELVTSSKEVLFVVNVVNDRGDHDQLAIDLADAIANEEHCWVVMKIIDPPPLDEAESNLMAALLENKNIHQVIGVIPADELRKSGVPISRSLSWERTLCDVVDHVQRDGLLPGNTPPHLVITFDYDAALYLKTKAVNRREKKERQVEAGDLIFSIGGAEGEFANTIEGTMPGAQSVFVSAFSAILHQEVDQAARTGTNPLANIKDVLSCALIAKRRFLESGFANTGLHLPFELEWTRIGRARRGMPRLDYSEGIFSHLGESSQDVSAKAPDPFILDERKIEQRTFHNPLKLGAAVAKTVQKHKLEHYPILADQLPNEGFSIFDKVAGNKKLEDFRNYVLKETAPKGVPICQFGKIKTAHVHEIEQLRTIGKLMQSYLSHPSGSSKPLGIAVFGPPGAGKSTAVKSIIENLPKACKKLVQDARHECNLSALVDPEDLAHYFQLARDAALRGSVPILFFDEFDCAVGGAEYFWLKHFLAPLQDGEFRSGHIVYPIGRAIFVFAGGVSETFPEFAEVMEENRKATHCSPVANSNNTSNSRRGSEPSDERASKEESSAGLSSGAIADSTAAQVNFKGVDFLSRLHGHIDVFGLSPKDEDKAFYHSSDKKWSVVVDRSYLMRRAFILRSLLQFHVPRIFSQSSPQEAQIDRRIVDALLLTKTFKHGTRSMEAIIRMSSVEGKDRFELSHLPPNRQLDMHVDSENLRHCLDHAETIWKEYFESSQKPPAVSERP